MKTAKNQCCDHTPVRRFDKAQNHLSGSCGCGRQPKVVPWIDKQIPMIGRGICRRLREPGGSGSIHLSCKTDKVMEVTVRIKTCLGRQSAQASRISGRCHLLGSLRCDHGQLRPPGACLASPPMERLAGSGSLRGQQQGQHKPAGGRKFQGQKTGLD